jgi:uncharacterized membrane protein
MLRSAQTWISLTSAAELTIATMPDQTDGLFVSRWRTRWAVALAVGIGILLGIFLHATAVPFGPVLLGMIAAFVGAIVVTAVLCILASDRLHLVGLGFATGVALAVVVASLAKNGVGSEPFGPIAQFVIVFAVVLVPAGLTSCLCAILKREDKRARGKNRDGP